MPTPQLVENTPMRQAQEPRSEAALLRIETSGAAPDGKEDLLDELLRRRSVEALQGEIKDQARMATVERSKRIWPAARKLDHQLFVGRCYFGGGRIMDKICHRPDYTHLAHSGLQSGCGRVVYLNPTCQPDVDY